ncbi:MAG TPA: sulfatase [Thermoanaerobaculia bacterium]
MPRHSSSPTSRAPASRRGIAGVARLVSAGVVALSLAACERPPQRILRLGTLATMPPAQPVVLTAAGPLGAEPREVAADLNAARIAHLELRARGTATLARIAWKLAGDPRFPPYRLLSFPLNPDGKEHLYDVDLEREPYWNGRVEALRLAADGGPLEVVALAGRPGRDLYRSMSLRGESVPCLPGLQRIDVRLPAGLPRGTVLEARLGLIPEADRPGARAVFRAYLGEGKGRKLWIERTVDGTGGGGGGWHPLAERLPAGEPRALSLEVEAARNGRPLPEGVALWGDPLLVTPGKPAGKNLVVVLIDTLRADALGVYGGRLGITPNLDAFGRGGIRFAEATAPAPWTLPSVTSLLTGLEPQTHGAGYRYGNFAPTGLAGGATTMAEVMRDHGAYTMGVYHNIYVNPAFGLQQGYDEYAAREERSEVLVDEALARLKRRGRDRRVFLYLHLFDLHNPYAPPEEECRGVARRIDPGYRGPLGCVGDRRPENPLPPASDWPWLHALYQAEVAYTDRQVGRLLAGLHDLGLDDDTVVAIVSDHGEEFWTRLDQERALGYEANSDHGHTHYRELLHVPAMIRVPGRKPAVFAPPVATADLFPTLLHLVGVAPPPNQGVDLVPLLDGAPAGRRTFVSDLLLHGPPRWAIRRGPWQLVAPEDPRLPTELYDLDRDPAETRNLAASQPAVAAELRALGLRLRAERLASRRRYLSGQETVGATYLEWNHITKLRSLGYLQ